MAGVVVMDMVIVVDMDSGVLLLIPLLLMAVCLQGVDMAASVVYWSSSRVVVGYGLVDIELVTYDAACGFDSADHMVGGHTDLLVLYTMSCQDRLN